MKLLQSDFSGGVVDYELRDVSTHFNKSRYTAYKQWDGKQSLSGKRLLVVQEQGAGDFIQFLRYSKLLAEQGAIVIIECHRIVAPLLDNLAWVSEVIIRGGELPKFDYYTVDMSFMYLLKTILESIPR